MSPTSSRDHESYLSYRRLAETELLPQAVRNAVLIFFLLQTFVFIPADYVLFPETFSFFFWSRIALNALLGVVYFGTSQRYPMTSSVLVCLGGVALFLAMINETGGASSGYYVGMILLVIGMGVLGPLTGKQGAVIASTFILSYGSLPLWARDAVDWSAFGQHLFFLGAACVEAAWACAYTDSMRFADFKQQRELKRARDSLAELDRAKSRFSANVHHELRTPLTLILAPLDALREGDLGPLSPLVERTLATMHSNGRRLYKMINNLLDLSKLESEQFEITRSPMHIAPLVHDLVEGARALAERKEVVLEQTGFDALPEINADPEAVEKVLVNLLGNALKFTEAGDRVTLSARSDSDEIRIQVADTGLGIDPAKLASIFDRFAQVDGSATRKHEGTGIGLSLAREMVELHGGRIWAESDGAGSGTTFHVVLPIGEPDRTVEEQVLKTDDGDLLGLGHSIEAVEADLQLESACGSDSSLIEMERSVERWEGNREGLEANAQVPSEETPEVLIAEDNPDMRELLAMVVGREFRTRVARNGREALDCVREALPDLILSDVMMPEMSGIELCRAIKDDPTTRALPVVLVTSKAEREMKIEGLELGADDYVTKPFHPRELLARVRSLVRVRALQKQLSVRNEELESALDELKLAEVQLVQSERLAAVGELAAGIAHEVNNPLNFALNAVRAMEVTTLELSELAADVARLSWEDAEALAAQVEDFRSSLDGRDPAELGETLAELMGIVKEGLNRTHSLVGDLRDFAAPNRKADTCALVDVEKGLRSTVQLLSHTLSSRKARIELDVAKDVPPIQADAGGLNQVYLNLIKNSAEAFGPPGGNIQVTVRRVGEEVELEVRDDGPGISAEASSRLFEPFYTTKSEGEGTGLGLSISHQIVNSHGGTLEAKSESGEGACFTVKLPITAEGGESPGA